MKFRNQQTLKYPTLYDSFCTHPACVQNHNTFFNYNQNSYHIQHKHPYKIIHAANFEYLFQTKVDRDYDSIIAQILQQHINKVVMDTIKYVRIKFIDPFVRVIKEQLRSFWINDYIEIDNLMKTGDHNTLQNIIKYGQSQKQLPFSHFSLQSASSYHKITNSFTELTQKIISILDLSYETLPLRTQTLGVQSLSRSQLANDHPPSSFNNQTILECDVSQTLCHLKTPKTKRIKKSLKYSNRLEVKYQQCPQNKGLDDYQQKWEIQERNQEQILIHHCSCPFTTLGHIKAKYSDLRKIHIFSSTFAKRNVIISLIKNYRNIQIFSLNCNHGLQKNDLNVFSIAQIKKMTKLQLKWNLQDYFQYFAKKRCFPDEGILEIERNKHYVFDEKIHKMLYNNQTITIENNYVTNKVKNWNIRLKKVKTLHFTATQENGMLNIKDLKKLTFINNLKVLHLKSTNFQKGQEIFSQFIKRNTQIQGIVIDQCIYAPNTVNKYLASLKMLPNLKNLFFCSRNQNLIIQPGIFFQCLGLQCLYLNEIHFNIQDIPLLSGIGNLKKLRHLGLAGIPQVTAYIFQHLDQHVSDQLQLLNISGTSVDRLFKNYLPKFRSLSYLNCDCLSIRGSDYLSALQEFYLLHGRRMELKSFSCEEPSEKTFRMLNVDVKKEWNFSIDEMKEMATHLPNLEYICVANCQSLKGYDFGEFKQLRIINLDPTLDAALKLTNQRIHKIVY